MSGAEPRSTTRQLLSNIAPFEGLSPAVLDELASRAVEHELMAGDILMREGDSGDSLFVVASGRLRAYVQNGDGRITVVGEIPAGESVGEMAILSDRPRSASVRAIRRSRLIELSRKDFEHLVEREPRALTNMTRIIVQRLGRSIHGLDGTGRLTTIALVPAGGTRSVLDVADALAAELGKRGSVLVVDRSRFDETSGDARDAATFDGWIQALEARHDRVLLAADLDDPHWTQRCLGQADRVLLIGDAAASSEMNTAEVELFRDLDHSAHVRVDLVMMHDPGSTPSGTARWTEARPGVRCFNLRTGTNSGVPRLARMLTGTAVNLVLSGGGARGLAHIGVVRALEERGIPIDTVGGASFGAVIAGIVAGGHGWEETRETVVRSLVKLGSPLDLTPPMIALARGSKIRHQLKVGFGATEIEDLWLPFFCVSSNLTRGEVEIHQSGPIWRALRASVAIPGVFPPMRSSEGEVLVDGAVMNNLPVDIGLPLGEPGPMLAVNLRSPVDMTAHDMPHDGEVSGWRALGRRMVRWRNRARMPGIMDTLLRTSEIGSVVSSKTFEALADVVFHPPVAEFALMDFSAYERLIETGYRHAVEVLDKTQGGLLSLRSTGED